MNRDKVQSLCGMIMNRDKVKSNWVELISNWIGRGTRGWLVYAGIKEYSLSAIV